MATIKSFTSVEQSKKLAEILPIDSADMQWFLEEDYGIVQIKEELQDWGGDCTIPCWSLAALLGVASSYCNRLEIAIRTDKKYNVFAVKDDFVFRSFGYNQYGFSNLVDACVALIEKLHELNLL